MRLNWEVLQNWRRAFGLLLFLASLGFFLPYVYANAGHLRDIEWSLKAIGGFGLAVVLYAGVLAIGCVNWFALLRVAGVHLGMLNSVIIFLTAQFAKYLPGNVAQHVSRVALARAYGCEVPRVLLSMSVEIALVMFGSVLYSVLALWIIDERLVGLEKIGGGGLALGALTMAAGVAGIAAMIWLKQRHGINLLRLNAKSLVVLGVLALNTSAYFLLGVAAMVVATGIFGFPIHDVFFFGAVTTLAWLAGFIAPGAPAGLGVREAMMVALLDPALGARGALGTTLAFRVVSLVTDGLAFAMAGMLRLVEPRIDSHANAPRGETDLAP